ncbi:hypothetical protein AKJ16_DCAP20441 [Drosera capensis]
MEFIEEEDEEKVRPVVGYFPSAYNPLDKERQPKPPRIELYRSDEPMKFVGTNYKGQAELAHHVSYGAGVLDRKNGTLKIVPIAGDKPAATLPNTPTQSAVHQPHSRSRTSAQLASPEAPSRFVVVLLFPLAAIVEAFSAINT